MRTSETMIPCKILPAALLITALPFSAFAFFHVGTADVKSGRALYAQHCAACHGANLEGQPDWRNPDAKGLYPAPPHDETGHTWHHDDEMLADYITRGRQPMLNDMGINFTSGMPGFAEVLEVEEIEAILDYIKSTWPEPIRKAQAERTQGMPFD
jgi:mono/diheme cytochrome c family protein